MKKVGGPDRRGAGGGGGAQDGLKKRFEVIVKMQKVRGWVRVWVLTRVGQGGCDRRIEVIVKLRRGRWLWVDVNEESKLLLK